MQPKLLVVDDDPNTCMQMKWALAQDFEILVAQNRPSALALFSKLRPPLVTLDLGLPPAPHGGRRRLPHAPCAPARGCAAQGNHHHWSGGAPARPRGHWARGLRLLSQADSI